MEKVFKVNISTTDKNIFEGEVSSLIVPGELGYLGILANHAPLISTLIPGKISFKDKRGKADTILSKGKGFLEVLENKVTLLLDSVA